MQGVVNIQMWVFWVITQVTPQHEHWKKLLSTFATIRTQTHLLAPSHCIIFHTDCLHWFSVALNVFAVSGQPASRVEFSKVTCTRGGWSMQAIAAALATRLIAGKFWNTYLSTYITMHHLILDVYIWTPSTSISSVSLSPFPETLKCVLKYEPFCFTTHATE